MNSLPKIRHFLAAAAVAYSFLSVANAQNIVNNPGFEAGTTFTGWTLVEPNGFSNVGTNPAFAHSGNNHANLAPDFGQIGSLSQMLATTPGTAYSLSFWLANFQAAGQLFQAYFNNVLVYSTSSPPFGTTGMYQQIVIPTVVASSSTTKLEFRYQHDSDFWYLDDVNVTAATPEGGASLWMLTPVLGALCLLHLRMRSRAKAGL